MLVGQIQSATEIALTTKNKTWCWVKQEMSLLATFADVLMSDIRSSWLVKKKKFELNLQNKRGAFFYSVTLTFHLKTLNQQFKKYYFLQFIQNKKMQCNWAGVQMSVYLWLNQG